MTTEGERARAAAAALCVNLFLGIAFVSGLALREEESVPDSLETFDVYPLPPPPLEMQKPASRNSKADPEGTEGTEGRRAEASPVTTPPAPIERATPVIPAPSPQSGTAVARGTANTGMGTGAGGSGSGSGGGGDGAGSIGREARLLGGNRARVPRSLLRTVPLDHGYAHLLLTVGVAGRVTACDVLTSTGYPAIDQALCGVMERSSRWEAARDHAGQPIAVKVRYTATWRKD